METNGNAATFPAALRYSVSLTSHQHVLISFIICFVAFTAVNYFNQHDKHSSLRASMNAATHHMKREYHMSQHLVEAPESTWI